MTALMFGFTLRSRLCFATPEGLVGSPLVTLVRQVVEAGAGLVIYRPPMQSVRLTVDAATDLLRICRRESVPLIVAGRVDVALAVTADGVLLEPDDLPPALARRLLGPDGLIGVAVAGSADVREAARQGASYLAVGPIFPASETLQSPPLGLAGLRQIMAATNLPVCASGGLTLAGLPELQVLAPPLVAVTDEIANAANPAAAARKLVATLADW